MEKKIVEECVAVRQNQGFDLWIRGRRKRTEKAVVLNLSVVSKIDMTSHQENNKINLKETFRQIAVSINNYKKNHVMTKYKSIG